MIWFVIYALTVNVILFSMMGIDKKRAKKKQWRISEMGLFLVAIVGGALGGTIGMYIFHHKTRHWYFVIGFPLILVVQCISITCFIEGKPPFIQ